MQRSTVNLPSAWAKFMDEWVPSFVKKQFSPRDSWKNKPFTKEDAMFFSKGVGELSELFTQERSDYLPPYFRHERFRSAYLLYFLPLQASKFVALFNEHSRHLRAALEDARKKNDSLTVVDLGAGPGTASIALVLWLSEVRNAALRPKKLTFIWWDEQPSILADGKKLLEEWFEIEPWKGTQVEIITQRSDWKVGPSRGLKADLVLMGNVLNEAPQQALANAVHKWSKVSGEGGVLMIEPALHRTGQNLSRIRDELRPENFSEKVSKDFLPWVGPCLHGGLCPLARGRDWCHFSSPVDLDGRWFKFFSRTLGSERDWIKYCYLWVKNPDATLHQPLPHSSFRRVVTDTLRRKDSDLAMVLLCEPEQTRRVTFASRLRIHRGDLVEIENGQLSKAMTASASPSPKRKEEARPEVPAVRRAEAPAGKPPRIHFKNEDRPRSGRRK